MSGFMNPEVFMALKV